MSVETSLSTERHVASESQVDTHGALQWIVDPAAALDAARRMESSCRNGLRFFSDYRRVRPLDMLDEGEIDPDAEVVEDGFTPLDYAFDPGFARRL